MRDGDREIWEDREVRTRLPSAGQHQGDVVGLFSAADPVVHGGSDKFSNAGQWLMAVVAHQLNQALLAKFAEVIFRLRDTVAEGKEEVALVQFDRALLKRKRVKQADH